MFILFYYTLNLDIQFPILKNLKNVQVVFPNQFNILISIYLSIFLSIYLFNTDHVFLKINFIYIYFNLFFILHNYINN